MPDKRPNQAAQGRRFAQGKNHYSEFLSLRFLITVEDFPNTYFFCPKMTKNECTSLSSSSNKIMFSILDFHPGDHGSNPAVSGVFFFLFKSNSTFSWQVFAFFIV